MTRRSTVEMEVMEPDIESMKLYVSLFLILETYKLLFGMLSWPIPHWSLQSFTL